jgi:hypothetical protein
MITVKHSKDDEWIVVVKGISTTQHKVRVSQADMDRYGCGNPAERLLEESFKFLLEREPNTSILSSFELPVIGKYFPEFGDEIRKRVSSKG